MRASTRISGPGSFEEPHRRRRCPNSKRGNQAERIFAPLTAAKIAIVEKRARAGQLHLPACQPNQQWSLGDSGASTCVADKNKHFPGAKIRPSAASSKNITYQNADGSPIPNRGEFDVPFTADAGHKRKAVFQDAPVMFPIISLGGVADAGNTVTLKQEYGLIVDEDTGETDNMIRRYGVYRLLLTLDDDVVLPPQDFQQARKP